VPCGSAHNHRAAQSCRAAVCDGHRNVVQVGFDLHPSWPLVQRCFDGSAAVVLPETPPAASAIGIDETRGKP
jgi:hypothetical protein